MPLNISLDDLVIAYRKAKADAFYENGHHTALSFARYEANLFENLDHLHTRIYSKTNAWLKSKAFVGTYSFILKSIEYSRSNEEAIGSEKEFVFYSDSIQVIAFKNTVSFINSKHRYILIVFY